MILLKYIIYCKMDWIFVIEFNNFNKFFFLSFKQLVSIPSDILNKNLFNLFLQCQYLKVFLFFFRLKWRMLVKYLWMKSVLLFLFDIILLMFQKIMQFLGLVEVISVRVHLIVMFLLGNFR